MIKLEEIALRQGAFALENVNLHVRAGSHAVLMGRSGTGKTTLLELICGLRRPASGRILLGDHDVTFDSPARRGIGYVPQDGAIFTTMRVRDQIGFGLSVRGVSANRIRSRVEELAALLGIEHLLARYPDGLSGGERQRIAIGRALAFRPSVLCLDEPTSSLDDSTRDEILEVIRAARVHSQATVLHVSHSAYVAKKLADEVFQIEDGRLRPVVDEVGASSQ